MNKSLILVSLFIGFPIILLSQGYTKTDSILIKQVKATNGICKEIKNLTTEISDLGDKLSKSDSIVLNSAIENINENYDSITNKFTAVVGEQKTEEEEKGFNFYDFISGALPEMLGALIGAYAAIWIFFSQTKKEKKKERDREEKELNEKNSYLGSLLQSSINLAKKQNSGIKEFYEEIDSNPLDIPLVAIHPKQDLERLSKVIDNEDYYHAFLNKHGSNLENIKLYRRIAGAVDYLNSQINQMFEVQDKGQKFDHERKIKYKELFDRARDYSAELGKQYQQSNPPLHKFIGDVLLKYYNGLNNSFDLKYHQDNLVTPLKEGYVKHFINIPEVRQITNDLKNATLIYSEIITQNENHSNSFKEFHTQIEKVVNFLEDKGGDLTKDFKKAENTTANKA